MLVKTWTLRTQDGESFTITNDEVNKMFRTMATRGNNFPRMQLNSGAWIFLLQVTSIVPLEYGETPIVATIQEGSVIKDYPVNSVEAQLELMKELSSCTHEVETLFRQDTKTGPRYFNVCDKCGRRGRYVKLDSLEEIDKINAKEWIE